MLVRKIEGRGYRRDHHDVGEVSRTSFAYGEIQKFGVESLDPIILDDTCDIVIEGRGSFEGIPIFYHCRKDLFIPDYEAELRDDFEALKHGAMAFTTGKPAATKSYPVKVMLIDDNPVAVIGHGDHQPRPCPCFFNFQSPGWGGTTGSFFYDTIHQTNVQMPNGVRRCKNEADRIMGGRPFQWGTMVYYYTDWLFRVGPVLWVWSARAMGMPMPLVTMCMAFAAPYSEALEEATIKAGADRDAQYRQSAYMYPGSEVGYPDFTVQTKLTNIIESQFLGNGVINPRWDYSKFYYQDFFREEENDRIVRAAI